MSYKVDAGLFDELTRSSVRTPEERLAIAVIIIAIRDLFGIIHNKTLEKWENKADICQSAKEYIFMQPQDYDFSFENLCHAVGFNSEALRDGLKAILKDADRAVAFRKVLLTFDHKGDSGTWM